MRKKLSLFFLMIVCIFTLSITNVFALDEVTEIAGARYNVKEVLETNNLAYGITHTKNNAQTSTSMTGYDADGFGGLTGEVVPGQYYDQVVNTLEVPASSKVRVTSWANLNNSKWTLTTVKGMINDYEVKNPGWKVVAAINGDFFDINGKGNLPYQTNGPVVSGGEYYRTSVSSGLVGFTNDGTSNTLIGNKVVARSEFMKLAVYNENGEIIKQFNIEKVNEVPQDNQTAVYYANYNAEHAVVPVSVVLGSSNGYFVDQAEYALPNKTTDFYGKGLISSVDAKEITKGQFAIVTNNPEVNQALAIGVKIRVQYELVGDYQNAKDITGAGSTVMINSADNPDGGLSDRAPRTVIGKKADGTIVMMVIDGRQANKGMYGADRTELSAIMASYGCVEAYNLDGGGSSTLIIRRDGQLIVMNSPSDGRERTDSNCILIVVKDPKLNTTANKSGEEITLNVELENNYGHEIKEMVVKMNNEFKTVTDGKVTFSNLTYNTKYSYQYYYRNNTDELIMITESGSISTLRHEPQFLGLEIYETADIFSIKILYTDVDNAGSFKNASLGINGKTTYMYNGTSSLKTTKIGYNITQLSISFNVNLDPDSTSSIQTITIEDPTYTITYDKSEQLYICKMFEIQTSYINEIYR